jgi:3-dehydroquinate dehydratase II
VTAAAARVSVINGPGLGALGMREPGIYGTSTQQDLEGILRSEGGRLGLDVAFQQFDCEGDIVSAIWAGAGSSAALVINPAGYSHTSVAVRDAMEGFPGLVVEVHISPVLARESFRRRLLTAGAADVFIAGAGLRGYVMALEHIRSTLSVPEAAT